MMDKDKKQDPEVRRLLIMAILAGRIMLKNGAETYRVEDTIVRICKSRYNIKYVESFVTPTGIFLSIEYNKEVFSYLKRIKSRTIDLNKINMVNNFSREFVNSNMAVEEGIEKLKKINKVKTYSPHKKIIFASIAAAFFSLLFDGSFSDFLASFLVSVGVVLTTTKLDSLNTSFFINNIMGAGISSILAILLVNIGLGESIDKIIIGSIMTLVPGVAITNAIRDTISGDFVSGISRGMEAIITALSIAAGVGMILQIYYRSWLI